MLGHDGGCGSILAVTAQNPGPDGQWYTDDDNLTPINSDPAEVSVDFSNNSSCVNQQDIVRNFLGGHPGGAVFANADGSIQLVNESIEGHAFRRMSTMHDLAR